MNNINLDGIIYKLKTLPDRINYSTKIARVIIGFPIKCIAGVLLAFFTVLDFIGKVIKNVFITGLIRVAAIALLLAFWPYHMVFMLFGLGQEWKYSFKPFLFTGWLTSMFTYLMSDKISFKANVFSSLYTTLPNILSRIPVEKIPDGLPHTIYTLACTGMENLGRVNTSLFYGMGHSYILAILVLFMLFKNCVNVTYYGNFEESSAVYETKYSYRKFLDWLLVRETYLLKDTWY